MAPKKKKADFCQFLWPAPHLGKVCDTSYLYMDAVFRDPLKLSHKSLTAYLKTNLTIDPTTNCKMIRLQ